MSIRFHKSAYMGHTIRRIALSLMALLAFCTNTVAGSSTLKRPGGDHIIGFALQSSILSGKQTLEQGYYHDGIFILKGTVSARNNDLFDPPFSAGILYGFHPSNRRLLLTAELAFTMIESKRVLIMSPYSGPELPVRNNNQLIFTGSLQVEALRPLSGYIESPVIPEAGIFLNFGAGNFERISWQTIAFTAGPVLAADIKFSRDLENSSFTALHVSLAYAQSFTDGWPSQLELSAGLRYSWR